MVILNKYLINEKKIIKMHIWSAGIKVFIDLKNTVFPIL